jgi:hypothetical protein
MKKADAKSIGSTIRDVEEISSLVEFDVFEYNNHSWSITSWHAFHPMS